jgi:Fe2+ transport system protein FeoA
LALSDVECGSVARVLEVPDDDPALLRRLGDLGLIPGIQVQVIATVPPNGTVTVRVGESEHILERELVHQLQVSLENQEKEE